MHLKACLASRVAKLHVDAVAQMYDSSSVPAHCGKMQRRVAVCVGGMN